MPTNSYTLTSRPWWLSYAIATPRGVVVAKVDAISTTIRHPTQEDIAAGIACGPRDSSPECHGELVPLRLGLTEQDIDEMGVTPGILLFPKVVDGPRPKTNQTDRPISEDAERRAKMALITEGHYNY